MGYAKNGVCVTQILRATPRFAWPFGSASLADWVEVHYGVAH